MNQIIEKNKIENMIYEIRGKQVMLDRDLANLYQIETRSLNQKVKRNINRFPEDFCFQMSIEEFEKWRSQNVMSISDKMGLRRPPYVFTEQGIAMLSVIINSNVAVEVSIKIMKAFVSMKKYISNELLENRYLTNMVMKHEEEIKLLQESFLKFEEKKNINEIYFNGQIYDAYSKIIEIFKSAKNKLVIIDSYADKTVLDIIRNIKVPVILIVKSKSLLNKLDIEKYNEQYDNLTVIYDDTFHDRYFIIDNDLIYHCGTSINKIGNKTFSINILEDDIVKKSLIDKVNTIILKCNKKT